MTERAEFERKQRALQQRLTDVTRSLERERDQFRRERDDARAERDRLRRALNEVYEGLRDAHEAMRTLQARSGAVELHLKQAAALKR